MDTERLQHGSRYARQLALAEIGPAGQARLAGARVLVVGAGGLGTPALLYLAAAGVGLLGIADDDSVAVSNLQRQILYRSADAGRPKATVAADGLRALNPEVRIEIHRLRVDEANAPALFRDFDLIVDGTDRLETKFDLNDAAALAGRPIVYGAALGFEAQVALFDARKGPCLRCLYHSPPETPTRTCVEAGILGAVTGMAGSLQALEAIRWLVGTARGPALHGLAGRLWLFDGRTLRTRVLAVPRDPACPTCGRAPDAARPAGRDPAVVQIAPEELAGLPDVLLIDVRETEEWAAGHLPGALHLPLSRLCVDCPPLPSHASYVTYCTHGVRSRTAAEILLQAGVPGVFSLAGGLAALGEGP